MNYFEGGGDFVVLLLLDCFFAGVDVDAGWKPLSGLCKAQKLFTNANELRSEDEPSV